MTPEERERRVRQWLEKNKPKTEQQRRKEWVSRCEKERKVGRSRTLRLKGNGGTMDLLRMLDAEKPAPEWKPLPRVAPPPKKRHVVNGMEYKHAYGNDAGAADFVHDDCRPPEWFEHEQELPRAVLEIVEAAPALHAVDDWIWPDNTDLWSEEDEYEFINKVPRPYGLAYPYLYRPG